MERRDIDHIPEQFKADAMADARVIQQPSATFNPELVRLALGVIVLTPHIREYLAANDPMALHQARAALGLSSKGGDE